MRHPPAEFPLLAALLLPALLAGCGLKTPPRPAEQSLPPTEDFQARLRPETAVLSWKPATSAQQERYGKPERYRLLIHVLPHDCVGCPPRERRRIDLPARSEELIREGGRIFYVLPLHPEEGLLRVQVLTWFRPGFNAPSRPFLIRAARDIPAPALAWRWANPAAEPTRPRAMLFSWPARKERFEWTVEKDGKAVEREVYYHANLYRRVPPQPWPITPLNPKPLPGPQWLLPPLEASLPAQERVEEYVLRFISLTGSEGPPSALVRVRIPARRP